MVNAEDVELVNAEDVELVNGEDVENAENAYKWHTQGKSTLLKRASSGSSFRCLVLKVFL